MTYFWMWIYLLIGAGSAVAHLGDDTPWHKVLANTISWPADVGFIIGNMVEEARK